MFKQFFLFEIRSNLRSPMPWIFMLVFALLSLGATVSESIVIGGSYGNVWKNAPYVLLNYYGVFSLMGILLMTAFFNSAALRDFNNRTDQIIFCSPISKSGYYFGHFFGGLVVMLIPFLGISLGIWLGTALNAQFEWIDLVRFGPSEVASTWMAQWIFIIPNTLFCGSILYAIAINSRGILYSFVAAMLILVGYIMSGSLLADMENENLAALLDPLGFRTFAITTKYWTPEEKNTQIPSLSGLLLINRLIWMAVGVAALMFGYWRFSFSEKNKSVSKKDSKKALDSAPETAQIATMHGLDFPKIAPQSDSFGLSMSQFWSQFKNDFLGILRSVPFLIILGIGLVNLFSGLNNNSGRYGAENLPVTYEVIETMKGSFFIFLIAILFYYSGVLIWKERQARMSEIYDSLPTKNWTIYLGKFAAMAGVLLVILLGLIACGIFYQWTQGYTRYDFSAYASELLGYNFMGFVMVIGLSMLVHVLSKNMYLGFFLGVILFSVSDFIWEPLQVSSNLVRLFETPDSTFSDFYRLKPYQEGLAWFNGYWLLFTGLLGVASVLFWPRGKEDTWAGKWNIAKMEWPRMRWVGLGLFAAWLISGAWIFYNTKVLNTIYSTKQEEKMQVAYENNYKKYQGIPQPRVSRIDYAIDIFPETRHLNASGKMTLVNRSAQKLDSLHVEVPSEVEQTISNARLKLLHNDSLANYRIYAISPALEVGDSLLLEFKTVFAPKGFQNELKLIQISQNGTFFNSGYISPNFGYSGNGEIVDKNLRKKYKLPERTRLPALNPLDTAKRMNTYISNDADWVHIETTISTSSKQTAIAPGSLVKEWTEGDRRYFQYKADHPSLNFYSFMSAEYEVKRRPFKGFELEVYYHKDHAYNVDRMLNSMEKSLDYYTTNFGPYYHKQCRIIEFPRWSSFAQAFAGTMPYSEDIGFIQDFADSSAIDRVFYVVAHEMAHQWWAHQECGAAMQGGEMLVETFAQYSALMVMEKEYGRDKMRRFLTYEMDGYLRGRSTESIVEQPLAKAENQGYIHYQKGSLVMYYLREMIGEPQVNAALRRFLEKYRYAPPPYPVSLDAIAEFEAETPDSLKYIIKDLFHDITLFDLRATEASATLLPDSSYQVTIKTESTKLKSDGVGKETETPINDWVEVGAFAKPEGEEKRGRVIHRQRVKIAKKDNTYTFTLKEKPFEVAIDPVSLLVDRNPLDNIKKVVVSGI